MFCVTQTTQNKIEVKKSTFTSILLPYSLFESYHDRLKKEHPKASHIIWAFRYMNEYGQVVEGGSDDGEPKGVAATPTLNILRGHELINTALLTVRYFGGTKLGTGGMVRAYGSSAKEVIMISDLLTYAPKSILHFETSYTLNKRYEHFFDSHAIVYHEREFKSDCIVWDVALTAREKVEFEAFVASL